MVLESINMAEVHVKQSSVLNICVTASSLCETHEDVKTPQHPTKRKQASKRLQARGIGTIFLRDIGVNSKR